jgi:hypothetical protein
MDRLIRRWEEAERRLYPSMVAQPDLVARYMRVVRAVAEELRTVHSLEELAEAWDRGLELAEAAARNEDMADDAPDLEVLAGAAFGLRYREVAAEAARQKTRRLIAEARGRGEGWVVLHEAGVPEVPFPESYRRLEMRLADGYALHLSAELDPDSGRPAYAIEGLRLDPATGEATGQARPSSRRFTDPEEWRRAARALRDRGPEPAG